MQDRSESRTVTQCLHFVMYDMLIGDIIPAGRCIHLVPGIYGPYYTRIYNICLDICVLPGSYIDEHVISPTTLADRNATIPWMEGNREGI